MGKLTDAIAEKLGSQYALTLSVPLIDYMQGDHKGALILNQMLYWQERSRIAGGWVAKSNEDWYAELRVKRDKVRQTLRYLESLGVVDTALKQFAGRPVVHFKINETAMLESVLAYVEGWKAGESPENLELLKNRKSNCDFSQYHQNTESGRAKAQASDFDREAATHFCELFSDWRPNFPAPKNDPHLIRKMRQIDLKDAEDPEGLIRKMYAYLKDRGDAGQYQVEIYSLSTLREKRLKLLNEMKRQNESAKPKFRLSELESQLAARLS